MSNGYASMPVEMVPDANGAHPEPRFNKAWSKLDQLAWKAGVVTAETGLLIRVVRSRYWIGKRRMRGFYDVRVGGYTSGPILGGSVCGPLRFEDAWSHLGGVEIGAREARRADAQAVPNDL